MVRLKTHFDIQPRGDKHREGHVGSHFLELKIVARSPSTARAGTGLQMTKTKGSQMKAQKASASTKSTVKLHSTKKTKPSKDSAKSKPSESRKQGKNGAPSGVTFPPLPEGCMAHCGAVERMILAALAYLRRLSDEGHPRVLVSSMCGYKNARSATYLAATKSLRDMGLVDFPAGDSICLTSAGVSSCGSAAARPTTNKEMHDLIKSVLKPKGILIFNALLDRRPHERSTLAGSVGFSNPRSEGFTSALKKMKELGVLESPASASNLVVLTSRAFPEDTNK